MHKNFTAWLRAAGLEPDDLKSPKQWAAISSFEPTAAEIISCARCFYGFYGLKETSLDRFGTAIQDSDTSFSIQDNRRELSVFAGAKLIAEIESDRDGRLAMLASLCLVCGGAQGARTDVPVPDMPSEAARYFEGLTSKRGTAWLEDDGNKAADFQKLEREIAVVGEESNMLWWLVSEYSRDRREAWLKLGLLEASIIAGKELADLTRVLPGPVAAAAFLDRVVKLSDPTGYLQPVSIKGAIDGTPREWKERYASKVLAEIEDLTPVSTAIKLSLTVPDGSKWSPAFEKGTRLESGAKLRPNALAYQVFLESLLPRLSEGVG